MTLDDLPLGVRATVASVDWAAVGERDARRLRELGVDEGVSVEPMHAAGWFARDPIAVRIGRMTIAMRRRHAAVIRVTPL